MRSGPLRAATILLASLAATASTRSPGESAGGLELSPCPSRAIEIRPGQPIQSAVDEAKEGAVFCIKAGVHRLQEVVPKSGQSFHGEGRALLSGARLIKTFERDSRYWVATGQTQHSRKYGECAKEFPACNMAEAFFIDDRPLRRVLSKEEVTEGRFYLDYASGRLYFVDNPWGRKVEATVARFAFTGRAGNVLIRNLVIEKYSSPAQQGAISGRHAREWTVEAVEARWNSGVGIEVGSGGRVIKSNSHHNGQLGVSAGGKAILLEGNEIWENNIYGFFAGWEAGGVKVADSEGVTFLGNHVHHNFGPGLWCDIDCRDVLYERNVVEHNDDAGIFHEISFDAVIRDNVVRFNGQAGPPWFWGAEIQIAASENVQVYGNSVTVAAGGKGIVLIDQNRPSSRGSRYKTRNNSIHDNTILFLGEGKMGGAADTKPGDETYGIIAEGHNRFDRNTYKGSDIDRSVKFTWGSGSRLYGCSEFREVGQEANGRCEPP